MSNPLVAAPTSSTNDWTGAGIADTINTLVTDLGKGDPVAIALGVASVGVDALAALADPFGTLLAAGFGWVIEHVPPLPEMLNSLAGNPDVIDANSKTWANVAKAVSTAADDFDKAVQDEVSRWNGPAISAYQAFAENEIRLLRAGSMAAEGIGAVVAIAGALVATVRCIVRDLIAEFCAKILSYLIEEAASLGFATPLVIVQISTAAAEWGAKILKWLTRLGEALKGLGGIMKRLEPALDALGTALTKCGYVERSAGHLPHLAGAEQLTRTVVKEGIKYGSYQLDEAAKL